MTKNAGPFRDRRSSGRLVRRGVRCRRPGGLDGNRAMLSSRSNGRSHKRGDEPARVAQTHTQAHGRSRSRNRGHRRGPRGRRDGQPAPARRRIRRLRRQARGQEARPARAARETARSGGQEKRSWLSPRRALRMGRSGFAWRSICLRAAERPVRRTFIAGSSNPPALRAARKPLVCAPILIHRG